MDKRPRRCRDCAAHLPPSEPGKPGRPPVRCDRCRATRRHRKTPTEAPPADRPRLRVVKPARVRFEESGAVDELEALDDPGAAEAAAAIRREAAPAPRLAALVADEVDDIESDHPAAAILRALARELAATTRLTLEPRDLATVSREIRATIADLTAHREANDDDDDLFSDGPLSPTLHYPAAT